MQWPLDRVIKVHPGADGTIGTVTIKTVTNTLDRGVKRLVRLPYQPDTEKYPKRNKGIALLVVSIRAIVTGIYDSR
jgi:hypothetical protein